MENYGREFVTRLARYLDEHPEETPAGLAIRAGLDNSAIRSLLSGRAQGPRLETAMKICAAIGTTIEEFMGQPRSAEERDILRLLSQLPVELRQRLLGYAEALSDNLDRSSREDAAETQVPQHPS